MKPVVNSQLVRTVGRIPLSAQRKLLVGFAGIVVLLVVLGVLGLRVLSDSNQRLQTLGLLPQRTATYRELQVVGAQLSSELMDRDETIRFTTGEANGPRATNVDVAFIDAEIEATLKLLNPFTAAANLGFVPPPGEAAILSRIRSESSQLYAAMGTIVADDEDGRYAFNQPENDQASLLEGNADRLVAITQRASDDLIAQNQAAYVNSQHLFIGVAIGGIVLALLLGVILSWVLIGPIKLMRNRLSAIAAGDFSSHVDVANRDELGALAADLNRMNDRLGQLYTELDETSRHKSEFLASMSHELRTPLNAVIGFSEVLQERLFGELNDKQAEYVADIHTSGKHLLALINDILDLSKIEAGRMDLQLSTFALAELMQNAVALMRERATRQGIALTLEVDPSVGVIDADERKLKQMLFNLLTNAIKFTGRGGHVTVTARAAGDEVVVCVRDDGAGIAPADQARIFEAFEQASASHAQEGTGLGLALSRRFIELHGGRLEVVSEPGNGSTFTVTVPRTQATRHADPATDPHPARFPDVPLATAAPRS